MQSRAHDRAKARSTLCCFSGTCLAFWSTGSLRFAVWPRAQWPAYSLRGWASGTLPPHPPFLIILLLSCCHSPFLFLFLCFFSFSVLRRVLACLVRAFLLCVGLLLFLFFYYRLLNCERHSSLSFLLLLLFKSSSYFSSALPIIPASFSPRADFTSAIYFLNKKSVAFFCRAVVPCF